MAAFWIVGAHSAPLQQRIQLRCNNIDEKLPETCAESKALTNEFLRRRRNRGGSQDLEVFSLPNEKTLSSAGSRFSPIAGDVVDQIAVESRLEEAA
jgi:hypothetical protein